MRFRRRMRALVLGGCLTTGVAGCGAVTTTAAAHPVTVAPTVSSPALQWIGEPAAGFAPWQAALAQARTGVDVNQYLLTDTAYAQALIHLAQRGIPVRVLLAANPYHDRAAVPEERQLFSGTRVQLHWAAGRFDQPYATDHAKYLLVNPGTAQAVAILGSPNGTASAFDGWNAEDAIETTQPAITQAVTTVFQADWSGHRAGPGPRTALVLSPGAEPALLGVLSKPGPVAVATEELGDVPALYTALARYGTHARLLVPPDALSTAEGREAAQQLVDAGVQIRTAATPYVHAKFITTATQTFIGSQNWSEPSLTDNREVGIITASPAVHRQALTWFDPLWAHAQPWPEK